MTPEPAATMPSLSLTRRRQLAVLWSLLILAACSLPGRSLPDVRLLEFDKFVHFALFAGLGALWMAALRMPLRRRAGVVLAVGTAYAWLTEVYQGLIPFERSPDPLDAIANTAGLLVAVTAFAAVRRIRRDR